MGKDHRLHGARAHPGGRAAAAGARAELSRVRADAHRRRRVEAGRALHGLRHPVLPERLSGQQRHPRLERPRLPEAVARRARRAALDEQFPRVHRPHLSGALRGSVHAQHQRRRRWASSRSSTSSSTVAGRKGWVVPMPPAKKTGKRVAIVGSGPGRSRLRAAAGAGRTRRGALREGRPHRRPAPLRDSRLQAGATPGRPAHGADVHRGRRVPAGRGSRQGCRGRRRCSPSMRRWS